MLKVIVLSGFLGSGKTTLVKNILTNTQSKRVAIILNDISQFDIDTDFVQKKSMQIKKKADIVQISNGCVCCTLKDDMVKEVKKIAKSKKFDYLVIQATGVSTPLPIAQAFAYTEGINKITEVLGMITVVDAQNFEKNLLSNQLVENQQKQSGKKRGKKQKKEEIQEDQKPTLAQLMIDQLQIADLVLINKVDLVSKKTLKQVQLYVRGLNSNSQVLTSSYSNVNLDQIFKKRFNLERAQLCLKWIGQRAKTQDIPQTIKYNISSFVYRSRRPFDPKKLHALLNSQKYWPFWNSITRAKGFFWLANYPRFQFSIQKAGMRVVYAIQQPWYCEMPKNKWAQNKKQLKQFQNFLKKYIEEPWGDKRNQIVFISKDMKRQEIQQVLNSCLIPASFLQKYEQSYSMIEDPFQNQWSQAINFFQKNDLLLQNQGDWQQMDQQDEEDDEEEYVPGTDLK